LFSLVGQVQLREDGIDVLLDRWQQNRTGRSWSLTRHDAGLRTVMSNAYEAVRAISEWHGCSLRNGVYILAIERVRHVHRVGADALHDRQPDDPPSGAV
jgi:glutamate dehydrogenase/leucine dehydrogenase